MVLYLSLAIRLYPILAKIAYELKFTTNGIICISILADVLDYAGMPLFAMPVIGDITDGIVISLLYSITKSKVSTGMNFIELIPFIGDLIPTYMISTLMWIVKERCKRRSRIIEMMSSK
jgi:arginase family enzyme